MLFSKLEKLGLAELPKSPSGEEHFLFYFHPTMAAIYMALLADYLAAAHSALTIPATDDQAAFDIAFGPERDWEQAFVITAYEPSLIAHTANEAVSASERNLGIWRAGVEGA